MSGYSVQERKLGKGHKPTGAACGSCGEPVANGKLLCDECLAEIAVEGTQNHDGGWRA